MKQTICNGCGEILYKKQQDYLTVQKEWGYFSEKDLETHTWNLCEDCYDRICKSFRIPVDVTETIEL